MLALHAACEQQHSREALFVARDIDISSGKRDFRAKDEDGFYTYHYNTCYAIIITFQRPCSSGIDRPKEC